MTSDRRPHIVHVVTDLGDGGAEAVLYRLLGNDVNYHHSVISLRSFGKYGPLLENLGVSVTALEMSPSRPSLRKFYRLVRVIGKLRPDLVQTWMYHADLLGGLAAWFSGRIPVVWGLHNTTLHRRHTKFATRLIVKVNALCSKIIPHHIISCSRLGAEQHVAMGFPASRMSVVFNGVSVSSFEPDTVSRANLRSDFGLDGDTLLFGCVARFDPQKDHANLLEAFSRVPDGKLLLVGHDMTLDNIELKYIIDDLNLHNRVIAVGPSNQIPQVMNALDVHVLSSAYGEAFPNVVCEAMATGTVCVSTEVGDSAEIIGNTGYSCKPLDSSSLSVAMERASVSAFDNEVKAACRKRIVDNFTLEKMVLGYNDVWRTNI